MIFLKNKQFLLLKADCFNSSIHSRISLSSFVVKALEIIAEIFKFIRKKKFVFLNYNKIKLKTNPLAKFY